MKNKILGLVGAILVLAVFLVPSVLAYTCPEGSIRGGGAEVTRAAECNIESGDGSASLMSTIGMIINVVLGLTGLLASIVIIYGGIQYTTSTGDPNKVKKAKDTITYGIIGLVVSLLAFAIVNFVIQNVFKAS